MDRSDDTFNFKQTTPGAAFEFLKLTRNMDCLTTLIIQEKRLVTSVTDTTRSIFQQ